MVVGALPSIGQIVIPLIEVGVSLRFDWRLLRRRRSRVSIIPRGRHVSQQGLNHIAHILVDGHQRRGVPSCLHHRAPLFATPLVAARLGYGLTSIW
jgi:hypothetical protein